MSTFYSKVSAAQRIVRQAQQQGLDARLITQNRGDYRKHSSLGSTCSPKRVVMISGKSWPLSGARQFLSGKKQQKK